MTPKELVGRAFAMMNGAEDDPAGFIHADFVNTARVTGDSTAEAVAEWSGPAGFQRTVTMLRTVFADLRFTIGAMVAEGDQVVVDTVMTGRHVAPIDGIPASGAKVENRQIHWFRVRDGLLAEHAEVRDSLQLMNQLTGRSHPA